MPSWNRDLGIGQLLNPEPDFSLVTVHQQVQLKHKRKIVVLGMIIPKVIDRIIIESDIVMSSCKIVVC